MTAQETLDLFDENGFPGKLLEQSGCVGRIELDCGPVITLYATGRALVQGKGLDKHRSNVLDLLEAAGWKFKR